MNKEQLTLLKGVFPQVNFNLELESKFASLWSEATYSKGEFILQENQQEKYFRFVLEGIQVLYILHKGKEIVLGFYYKGLVCSNFRSFLRKKPSELCIKTITPTKTLNISVDNYYKLFELSPDFQLWNRECYEYYIIDRFDRELDLLTLSAKERYDKFIVSCPDILHEIPQKYLASYLNMSQETYSRIRGLKN